MLKKIVNIVERILVVIFLNMNFKNAYISKLNYIVYK